MPLGKEEGCGPGHIVLDGDPASPKRGTTPNFRPMSIVAKRSPISATAEHLFILFFWTHRIDSIRLSRQKSNITRILNNLQFLNINVLNVDDHWS